MYMPEKLLDRWQWRLLFSGLAVFVILSPQLLGFSVLADDGTEHHMPQMAFYQRAFQNGESPFWTPGIAGGFPAFVTNGFPYNPFYLPLYFFNPIDVHYWGVWVMLSLTLFFTISFLRELGIGVWGSLIGGLGYLMGSIYLVFTTVQAPPLLNLAVVFWALVKIHKSAGWKKYLLLILLGAATVAINWLLPSGFFGNFYIFLAALAFVIFLVFKERFKHWFKLPLALFFMFALGTLIGLLQIVPAFVLMNLSGRAGGVSASMGDTITPQEFLNFTHIMPEGSTDAYLYIGVVGLLFLIISFFSKNSFAKFFRWVFLAALAIAVQYSPLYWFLHQFPPFKFFQSASRSMLIGTFASVILAGFGIEQFILWIKERNFLKIKKIIFPIMVGIAAALILALMVFPPKSRHVISVLVAGLFLLTTFIIISKKLHHPKLLLLLAAVAAADFIYVFFIFTQPFIGPHPPFMISRRLYQEDPPGAAFLRENPGRIFWVFPDDFDNDFYYAVNLPQPKDVYTERVYNWKTYNPNSYLVHGVENLEGYDPILNVEMGRFMALLGAGRELRSSSTLGEQKLDKLNVTSLARLQILKERMPLADFLGIRYLISGYDLKNLGFEVSAAATEEFKFMTTSKFVPSLTIFENLNAKPPVYFSAVSGFTHNSQTAYELFKAGGFRGIFVECRDCADDFSSYSGEAAIIKRESGLVDAETTSESNQFLVFSQNFLPGWKAFIDGRETPLYKVNSVFMGTFVPAGKHRVSFEYRYWDLFRTFFKNVFSRDNGQ
jgi:hypothetical protein